MTIEITTEAQAQAARELIAAVDKCLTHWPTSSLLTEDAQAALSAYEAQKAANIVLSEDELIILRYGAQEYAKFRPALDALRKRDFIDGSGIVPTPAGRAYLAAHKPPINPQRTKYPFEVWHTPMFATFICACKTMEEANKMLTARARFANCPESEYEVREVQ